MTEQPTASNFKQITPLLHVPDLEKAIQFFRDGLGFTVWFRMEEYAYLHRETVGMRLLQQEERERGPHGNRGVTCYVDVHNVDTLFAEIKPYLDTLPADHIHGPVDQHYGQRELIILMPDGNCIAFGHALVEHTFKPE